MSLLSRIKTWASGNTLTHTDLNAEFDNIIDNLDPDNVEDASADAAAMQASTIPYTQLTSTASLATDLRGELQRLRYVIKQITGKAQWYIDSGSVCIPRGWYSGLVCKQTAVTTIDIDADSVVVEDSNNRLYQLTDINLTCDITSPNGINALDTGSEATSTWYYGWVIYNAITDTVAGLLSTSGTLGALTLPSGYTYGKIVTVVCNDNGDDFTPYEQNGNHISLYNMPINWSYSIVTVWTDKDMSNWIPPNTYLANYQVDISRVTTGSTYMYVYLKAKGSSVGDTNCQYGIVGDASSSDWVFTTNVLLGCDSSQVIEYKLIDANSRLTMTVNDIWIKI